MCVEGAVGAQNDFHGHWQDLRTLECDMQEESLIKGSVVTYTILHKSIVFEREHLALSMWDDKLDIPTPFSI